MLLRSLLATGVLALALSVSSCGPDEEQEARSREQQARIAELQARVDVLTRRLGTPEEGDPAADLQKAEAALQEATDRAETLRSELDGLNKERAAVEKEFEEYKRKYQIPE